MNFSEWTLETIREEGSCFSWMEELRFHWIPQAQNAIKKILDGVSIILVTDRDFKWFSNYISDRINAPWQDRPFLPIYQLEGIFPAQYYLNNPSELDFLYDLLDISFSNGYFFWYIGSGKHKFYEYIEQDKDSLIWSLNKEIEGIFSLKKSDPMLDIKLIQAFKLFNKTINGAMFGEIEL